MWICWAGGCYLPSRTATSERLPLPPLSRSPFLYRETAGPFLWFPAPALTFPSLLPSLSHLLNRHRHLRHGLRDIDAERHEGLEDLQRVVEPPLGVRGGGGGGRRRALSGRLGALALGPLGLHAGEEAEVLLVLLLEGLQACRGRGGDKASVISCITHGTLSTVNRLQTSLIAWHACFFHGWMLICRKGGRSSLACPPPSYPPIPSPSLFYSAHLGAPPPPSPRP